MTEVCFVYLLTHASEPVIKIGLAADVRQRDRQLRDPIAMDKSFMARGHRQACAAAERALHKLFWKDRIPKFGTGPGCREWFRATCLPRALMALEIFGTDMGLEGPKPCGSLSRKAPFAAAYDRPAAQTYDERYRERELEYLSAVKRLFDPSRLIAAGVQGGEQEKLWGAARSDEDSIVALDVLPRYSATESFLLIRHTKYHESLCDSFPDGYWTFDFLLPEVRRRLRQWNPCPLLADLLEIANTIMRQPVRHAKQDRLFAQYLAGCRRK